MFIKVHIKMDYIQCLQNHNNINNNKRDFLAIPKVLELAYTS